MKPNLEDPLKHRLALICSAVLAFVCFPAINITAEANTLSKESFITQANSTDTTFFKQAERELGSNVYPLYRVTEKILRANQLDEMNWRIVVIDKYDINAFATEANLIAIYSGLLDQIYGDTHALACVIGHEIGHHNKRHIATMIAQSNQDKTELINEIQEDEKKAQRDKKNGEIVGRILGLPGSIFSGSDRAREKKKQEKIIAFQAKQIELSHNNEFEADQEGLRLTATAGYDPKGCLRLLDVLSRLPGGAQDSETHPNPLTRIDLVNKSLSTMSLSDLKSNGLANLNQSNKPLTYSPSSDGYSLRINSKRGSWDKF